MSSGQSWNTSPSRTPQGQPAPFHFEAFTGGGEEEEEEEEEEEGPMAHPASGFLTAGSPDPAR